MTLAWQGKVSLRQPVGGGVYLWQRLIDLRWVQTSRAQPLQPLQPLLFLSVSPGTLHAAPCARSDPLLQQLQLALECVLVGLVCSLAQSRLPPSAGVILTNAAQEEKISADAP